MILPPKEIFPETIATPEILGTFQSISRNLPEDVVTPPPLAINELKLLHHFITYTYDTLGTTEHDKKDIWKVTIPRVGFEYPFLTRGLLCISALHLATREPDSAAENLVFASTQYNNALVDFRTEIGKVDDESCIAVFAFSCVTVVHALGVAQVQKPDDPITDLQNCLSLVKGVLLVLQPHLEALTRSGVLENSNNFVKLNHTSIPEVLELRALAANMSDHTASGVCVEAIDLLHRIIYSVISSNEEDSHLNHLFSWPTVVGQEFFDILHSRHPVAILIITFFAASMGYQGGVWWLKNWNIYIMEAAEAELPHNMLRWLEWPKRIIAMSGRLSGNDGR
jgi:hypothetical protein